MSFGYQVLGFGAFPNRTPPAAHNVGFSAMFDKVNNEHLLTARSYRTNKNGLFLLA